MTAIQTASLYIQKPVSQQDINFSLQPARQPNNQAAKQPSNTIIVKKKKTHLPARTRGEVIPRESLLNLVYGIYFVLLPQGGRRDRRSSSSTKLKIRRKS
jgi:hypothetical protein